MPGHRDADRGGTGQPLATRSAPQRARNGVDHRTPQAGEPADDEGVHLGGGVVAFPRGRARERGRDDRDETVENTADIAGGKGLSIGCLDLAGNDTAGVDRVSPAPRLRELKRRDNADGAVPAPPGDDFPYGERAT